MNKNIIWVFSTLPNSASWEFYSHLFLKYSENSKLNIRCFSRNFPQNLSNVDVLILFGPSHDIAKLRAKKTNIIIGYLEPRAAQKNNYDECDFIIVNSIEAHDFFSSSEIPIFIYPTYPIINPIRKKNENQTLIIGYHGNKIHLDAMDNTVSKALSLLRKDIDFEFWVMYNIRNLGLWKSNYLHNVKVNHIQYDIAGYNKFISRIDIGIIPQLIPVKKNKILRWFIGSLESKFNERFDNFFHRFKETTNNGRAFVFAQFGIPIIADMTPSSCALIGENEYGFLASSEIAWYTALKILASNKDKRRIMGMKLKKRYERKWNPKKINKDFSDFISQVVEDKRTI